MKLTGEQLYALYTEEYNNRSVGLDGWEELEANDREVWDALAERLGDRIFRVTGEPLPDFVATLRIIGPAGNDIGSFEEVFGGYFVDGDQTLEQALAAVLPQGFSAVAPGAKS